MKICIPILSFSKSGGMKVLTEFANRAKKFGHCVTIVVPIGSDDCYYPTNVEVIKLDIHGRQKEISKKKKMPGIWKLWALYRYLRKNSKNFDVVIANHNLTAYPVYLGSSVVNIYYVQAYEPEFADEYPGIFKRNVLKFAAWITYKLPLVRIVNSDIYLNYKNLKAKYVAYPGMNLEIFRPYKEEKKCESIITIGCIGRNEKWKGSGDVAEAVDILRSKGIKLNFKVAFFPVFSENFELVFPHGHEALAEFYRSLDVMVAPGHIQLGAIHYPVIEAMACGIPVVTTGYYPANEFNSIIVPIKSPDKIASAIERIINNEIDTRELTDAALDDVSHLSWDKTADKFYKVINSLISIK